MGDIPIYGQESNSTTWRLAKMNPAIRGIDSDLGAEHAGSFRRGLHRDFKAGRHAFPETICRHTMTLGTSNAL